MERNPEGHAADEIARKTFHGPVCDFVVLSRSRIATAAIDVPYIVVSISDPGDSETEIAASPLCRGILRLQFDDIDPERRSLRHGAAMTEQDARTILDFVHLHLSAATNGDRVNTIVCQCGLGISRSAGVAAALSRTLQDDDTFFFANFSPNSHVYRMLLAAQ